MPALVLEVIGVVEERGELGGLGVGDQLVLDAVDVERAGEERLLLELKDDGGFEVLAKREETACEDQVEDALHTRDGLLSVLCGQDGEQASALGETDDALVWSFLLERLGDQSDGFRDALFFILMGKKRVPRTRRLAFWGRGKELVLPQNQRSVQVGHFNPHLPQSPPQCARLRAQNAPILCVSVKRQHPPRHTHFRMASSQK